MRSLPVVVTVAFAPEISMKERFGLIATSSMRVGELSADIRIIPCPSQDIEYDSSLPMSVRAMVSLINLLSPSINSYLATSRFELVTFPRGKRKTRIGFESSTMVNPAIDAHRLSLSVLLISIVPVTEPSEPRSISSQSSKLPPGIFSSRFVALAAVDAKSAVTSDSFFIGYNNQNKAPTRRMSHLNPIFPRRSP
jgi:hypothetical protein